MTTDLVHYVTVEHELDSEGDVISSTLTFECRGTPAAPCHHYPACDCEYWSTECEQQHARVQQDECWLKSWFDVGVDVTPYEPAAGISAYDLSDVPAGSGPIDYDFEYDYVAWRWVAPASDPQQPGLFSAEL